MDSFVLFLNRNSNIFIPLLVIWSLTWKGFALWRSAKANQRNWFIAILLLSTAGILEIIYFSFFQKGKASKK